MYLNPPYNSCDGAHDTLGEIRRLETGGGAGALLCLDCYKKELRYRLGRIFDGVEQEMPRWEDLTVDQEKVILDLRL